MRITRRTRGVVQPFPGVACRVSRELTCNTGCGYKFHTQWIYVEVVTKVTPACVCRIEPRTVSFKLNRNRTLYAHGYLHRCATVMLQLFYSYATVMLQLYYSYAIIMLQLCFSYTKVMLKLCYSYATVILQLCYGYATVMLRSPFMLQLCYSYGTVMLQLCYNYATFMLQLWYSYATVMVQLCYIYATVMVQLCYSYAKIKLQLCSIMLQSYSYATVSQLVTFNWLCLSFTI